MDSVDDIKNYIDLRAKIILSYNRASEMMGQLLRGQGLPGSLNPWPFGVSIDYFEDDTITFETHEGDEIDVLVSVLLPDTQKDMVNLIFGNIKTEYENRLAERDSREREELMNKRQRLQSEISQIDELLSEK